MSGVDINRGSSNFVLPADIYEEIWSKAKYESAVMQLSRRIELPGRGLEIQTITGDPIAEWVAETDAKPISNPTLGKKTMKAYKLAYIDLISEEALRDKRALYDWMIEYGPSQIAKAFDTTVFNGTAPGTGFDDLSGADTVALGEGYNVYQQLVAAKGAVAAAGGSLNGFVFDANGETTLLSAVDGIGRPLFSYNEAGAGPILGARVLLRETAGESGTPNIIGIGGDWSKTRYGIVGDIAITPSREATLVDGEGNVFSTFQHNMVAIRVEAELGFIAEDDAYFVRFTDEAAPEPEPGD